MSETATNMFVVACNYNRERTAVGANGSNGRGEFYDVMVQGKKPFPSGISAMAMKHAHNFTLALS